RTLLMACLALLIVSAPGRSDKDTPAKPEGKKITLEVRLPADAKLEIEGKMTKQTGPVRRFVSPPVVEVEGQKYIYTLKATWKGENGAEEVVLRQVEVKPGTETKVDLHKDRPPDVIYEPTPEKVVEAMLELAKVTKDDVV